MTPKDLLQFIGQNLLKALCAWLIARGYINAPDAATFAADGNTIVGVICGVAGLGWHWNHAQALLASPPPKTASSLGRIPLMAAMFACLIVGGSGCAFQDACVKTYDPQGKLLSITRMKGGTFFDANASLAKAAAGSGGTNGAKIFVSGLSENSQGSNAVQALQTIAGIAAAAAK